MNALLAWYFVAVWGSGYIATKIGLQYAPPFTFLTLRFAFGLLCLAPVVLIWKPRWPASRGELAHLAIAGLLMHAVQLGGSHYAQYLGMSAGVAALVISSQPLFTAFIASRFLSERLRPGQWLGVVVGLAGVALVVWHKVDVREITLGALLGTVVALAGHRRLRGSRAGAADEADRRPARPHDTPDWESIGQAGAPLVAGARQLSHVPEYGVARDRGVGGDRGAPGEAEVRRAGDAILSAVVQESLTGVRVVRASDEADDWLAAGPVLAEQLVDFRRELAQLVARRPSGEVAAWPLAETVQRDGVCAEVIAPAPEAGTLLAEARDLAVAVAEGIDVTGVLAVEQFETTD
mgnify:CR=1 FL=1